MTHTERPLVTFALLSYMHRPFIRDAVKGAFSQTYAPLEIIISDDASSDGSFELIESLVSAFRGSHRIIVNRNRSNLGIAGHINHVMRLAQGEFVVLAAGDDVSLPVRTKVLVDHWLQAGRPEAICSGFDLVNRNGITVGSTDDWYRHFLPAESEELETKLTRLVTTGVPSLIGCSEAWSRDFYFRFPPLSEDVWFEDVAVAFRAWLAGRIVYLPDKLVDYRRHETNISNYSLPRVLDIDGVLRREQERSLWMKRKLALLDMHAIDISHAFMAGICSEAVHRRVTAVISKRKRRLSFMIDWWGASYWSRLRNAGKLLWSEPTPEVAVWTMPRLLPIRPFGYLRRFLDRFMPVDHPGA
jgi:GT2 family glycosyltransferase